MEEETGGTDPFHRNEAISAVQDDDQYLGDEDYEDYDDLYNDVNVGDRFHQSVPRRDDLGFNDGGVDEKIPLPQQRPPQQQQLPPSQQFPPLLPVPVPVVPENVSIPGIAGEVPPAPNLGFRGPSEPVGVRPPAMPNLVQLGGRSGENSGQYGNPGRGNEGFARQGGGAGTGTGAGGGGPANYNNVNGSGTVTATGGGGGGGGTILFVGDLHWWTTDADLEAELFKYGQVKEVKFFDEKASGKSKGYCQVEFYDPIATAACKEGMNGHIFNGKPCVVAFASPFSVRRMGEAQLNKNQTSAQSQSGPPSQGRGRGGSGIPAGANYGGRGGNWGRGGGNFGGRGQMGNNIRNRMGPVGGGRGIMGNGGMFNPPPQPMLNPANMFGQGFDPTGFGGMMGRIGTGYGAFPAGPAAPTFTGMMPSFPTMVAPHVNPAFFGRGMAPNAAGMWPDPNAGGWGAEEQSSYGEDAASDHQYGEGSHGKDRVSDREWSGAPERKHRDERERGVGPGHDLPERRHHDDREKSRDREREREKDREHEREKDRERDREKEKDRERDRYRDDRERHGDQNRHRERESYRDDDWDRSRQSRPRSKSRELEYSKRRRATPG